MDVTGCKTNKQIISKLYIDALTILLFLPMGISMTFAEPIEQNSLLYSLYLTSEYNGSYNLKEKIKS